MSYHAVCTHIVVLIASTIACVARGQVPGDSNADGRLSASDFPAWESCLLGPSVPGSPECGFFGEGTTPITLASMLQVQPGAQQNAGCFPDLGRMYVGMLWGPPTSGNFYGCSGIIAHGSAPTLCGEPTETAIGYSDAWMTLVGATDSSLSPTKWAQFGFTCDRGSQGPPTTNILVNYFCEVKFGLAPANRFLFVFGPPTPPVFQDILRHFDIHYESASSGSLRFVSEDIFEPFSRQFSDPGWVNLTPQFVQFKGETYNMEDEFWGRFSLSGNNPCLFGDLRVRQGNPLSHPQTPVVVNPNLLTKTTPHVGVVPVENTTDAFRIGDYRQ